MPMLPTNVWSLRTSLTGAVDQLGVGPLHVALTRDPLDPKPCRRPSTAALGRRRTCQQLAEDGCGPSAELLATEVGDRWIGEYGSRHREPDDEGIRHGDTRHVVVRSDGPQRRRDVSGERFV